MKRLAPLVLAAVGAGCSGPEAPGTLRSAIVFGDPSPSPSDDDAVLLLHTTDERRCTATLVAPNLVVTARHCVAYLAPGVFGCTREGELTLNPEGAGQLGADDPPETIQFYAGSLPGSEPVAVGAAVVSSLSPSICDNDLAFVVLDRQLDLPIKPLRLGARTSPGELVTVVGYGLTENPATSWRDAPRRRKTGIEIVDVGPDSLAEGVILTPPRKLRIEAVAPCSGDSGGPALSEQTGALLGVYSIANTLDCASPEVVHLYTHVAPFVALAQQAFAAAGAEPSLEPPVDGGTDSDGGMDSDAGADPDAGDTDASACDGDECERPSEAESDGSGCSLSPAPAGRQSWLGLLGLGVAAALSAARRADRR